MTRTESGYLLSVELLGFGSLGRILKIMPSLLIFSLKFFSCVKFSFCSLVFKTTINFESAVL